jgi:hypothetical protein
MNRKLYAILIKMYITPNRWVHFCKLLMSEVNNKGSTILVVFLVCAFFFGREFCFSGYSPCSFFPPPFSSFLSSSSSPLFMPRLSILQHTKNFIPFFAFVPLLQIPIPSPAIPSTFSLCGILLTSFNSLLQ